MESVVQTETRIVHDDVTCNRVSCSLRVEGYGKETEEWHGRKESITMVIVRVIPEE